MGYLSLYNEDEAAVDSIDFNQLSYSYKSRTLKFYLT